MDYLHSSLYNLVENIIRWKPIDAQKKWNFSKTLRSRKNGKKKKVYILGKKEKNLVLITCQLIKFLKNFKTAKQIIIWFSNKAKS